MSLAQLEAWCGERGIRCYREDQPTQPGYAWVRIYAELDGRPVFSERICPADRADAMADELAAGVLHSLRAA